MEQPAPATDVEAPTKASNHAVRRPRDWHVLLFGGSGAPDDFVASEILVPIFSYAEGEAAITAGVISDAGSAIVGTYGRDVALTKVHEAMVTAAADGWEALRAEARPETTTKQRRRKERT